MLEATKIFEEVVFIKVLREENSQADQLSIEAAQLNPGMTRSISVDILSSSSIAPIKTSQSLIIGEQISWMMPYKCYLLEDVLPNDKAY